MEADNDDIQDDLDEPLYGDDNDLYVQLGDMGGKMPLVS